MAQSILLIISGSIAAYKSLELIRRLRDHDVTCNCILTKGGAEFITPLSVASLSGQPVYHDLFSLKDETEMGHIRLSRESDLVVVAPASADIIAKMAHGQADDLATTALLATDKPVMIAPAMNSMMWDNPATQRNLELLVKDGIDIIAPDEGNLACGEIGTGRLAEVDTMLDTILTRLKKKQQLAGKHALVTAGPTYEPIDPVRFIGNRSSGKQGYAIAKALSDAGANVTLISGPTALKAPPQIKTVTVQTAKEMLKACEEALPADIAVCTAAVSDWKAQTPQTHKMKKRDSGSSPTLTLSENPDILKTIATHKNRPNLVVGFAAETEDLIAHAKEKLQRKKCDWVLANDVSEGVFGEDQNTVTFITKTTQDPWEKLSKREVANRLTDKITEHFKDTLKLVAIG